MSTTNTTDSYTNSSKSLLWVEISVPIVVGCWMIAWVLLWWVFDRTQSPCLDSFSVVTKPICYPVLWTGIFAFALGYYCTKHVIIPVWNYVCDDPGRVSTDAFVSSCNHVAAAPGRINKMVAAQGWLSTGPKCEESVRGHDWETKEGRGLEERNRACADWSFKCVSEARDGFMGGLVVFLISPSMGRS